MKMKNLLIYQTCQLKLIVKKHHRILLKIIKILNLVSFLVKKLLENNKSESIKKTQIEYYMKEISM